MYSQDYDIIVECLVAGSEFEVTVRETDTIGYLKCRIKKYEGIPVSQQHILYNQKELKDSTVLKDVPLVRGSRLTLVLGMRGGPISARRVVTDCENWYDLSDVLNGTNRSQLTPIEPLTISTTGVKVLLYKDCKKNINRLMKLRKHHLHGAAGSGVGAAAGAGANGGGAGGGAASSSAIKCPGSYSARAQLKFMDKNVPAVGVEPHGVSSEDAARNQQWLLDNLTTLKKMKHLRQSLDAKKKKKPRPENPTNCPEEEDGYFDDFSQDLKDVQMDLEMQEKLQRWLHRVASNATHLTDGEVLAPHGSAIQPCHSAQTHLTASSNPLNIFDRMRRKSGLGAAVASSGGGSMLHQGAPSLNIGGARKKDSYPLLGGGVTAMMPTMPVDEFYMGYSSSSSTGRSRGVRPAAKLPAEAEGVTGGVAEEDEEEESPYTRLSIEEIDRRLAAANDMEVVPVNEERHEHLIKRRQESSGQFEERLLTQFYDNSSVQCENLFKAYANGKGDRAEAQGAASKFRWRFQRPEGDAEVKQRSTEEFLSSVLKNPIGDYQKWTDTVEEQVDKDEEEEVQQRETVIIEKAENEEESLLEAACSEILNDPEAFDEEGDDEDEEEAGEDADQLVKRYEMMDFMRLESEESGESDSTEGELSCLLKDNNSYFDLEEDEDEDEEEEEDDNESEASEDDPVLLYEEEETGTAAFQFSGAKKAENNYWPNFDVDNECADQERAIEKVTCAIAPEVSDEEPVIACPDAEALEFDDFAYFPARSSISQTSSAFRRQSSSLRPPSPGEFNEKAFLPRIKPNESRFGEGVSVYRPPEPRMGPSLPEIIKYNTRARSGVTYSTLESLSASPTTTATSSGKKKREREEGGRSKAQLLPDIKLLESDLKRMGLADILDDNDDSFERTIKRHFVETRRGHGAGDQAHGECLLRSGNEANEQKRMKPVEGTQEWLIPGAKKKEEEEADGAEKEVVPAATKVVKGNRCAKCNKKLGIIMIMKCHCGLIFCAEHRYAEAHDCAYDFKEEGKRMLAKENPLVVGEKLPKI